MLLLAGSLLTGCPGDLKNPDRFPAELPPECVGNIDVVEDIFRTSCGTSSCHEGEDPAAGLNLLDGNAFDNLFGQPSTSCEGRMRIDPAAESVRDNFLIDKLLGASAIPPGCGDPMPFLSRLSGNEISCVQRWILDNMEGNVDGGMPRDSGAGDMDSGGGDMDAGAGEDAGEDAGPGEDAATDPCQPIEDGADWVLCDRGPDTCTGEFQNSSNCMDLCASAGLVCTASFQNIGSGDCMFDNTMPLDCMAGNMSDYCECGRP
ncbi:MAG: hypothetical protein AAGE52_07890 [Myxococcota bacterium]